MKYTVDDIKICVYTICKNEEFFAERWLASAQEADAIFVNDTGSTDKTVEILEKHPKVKLIHGKACGENFRFDKAWNEVLEIIPDTFDFGLRLDMDIMMTCGWCQILKQEIIKKINEGKINLTCNNVDIALYQEQDYYSSENLNKTSFHVCYVHTITKEGNYFGAVHEDFFYHNFKPTAEIILDKRKIRLVHTKKTKNTQYTFYQKLAKIRFLESPNYFNYLTWVCCSEDDPREALSYIFEVLNEMSQEASDTLAKFNFTLVNRKHRKTSRFYVLCLALLYCIFCEKDFNKIESLFNEIVSLKETEISIKNIDYFFGAVLGFKNISNDAHKDILDLKDKVLTDIFNFRDKELCDYIINFYETNKNIIKKVLS